MTNEYTNVKVFPDDTSDMDNDYNNQILAGCESDCTEDNSKDSNLVVNNDSVINTIGDTNDEHADNIIMIPDVQQEDVTSTSIFYDEEEQPLLQKKRKTRPDRSKVQYIVAYDYHCSKYFEN